MLYNNQFMDNMDTINNLAKSKEFVNGIGWSDAAKKAGEISSIQHIEHEKCHKLRNAIAHGNARDISVSVETLNVTKDFLKRIENTRLSNNKPLKKEAEKSSKETYVAKKEEYNNLQKAYNEAFSFGNKFINVSKGINFDYSYYSDASKKETLKENLSYCAKALECLEKYLKYSSDEKKVEVFKLMKNMFEILEMQYYLSTILNAKARRIFYKHNDQAVEQCESCYKKLHSTICASKYYNHDCITLSDLKIIRELMSQMLLALNKVNEIYSK